MLSSTPLVVPPEIRQEPHRLFKSIRRYLVKHALGNRVALMVWVGRNLSSPEFKRRVEEDPYVRVAWIVLSWMQRTHWATVDVKRWFRRLLGVTTTFPKTDYDPIYHWTNAIQDHVVIHHGGSLERWIVNWVNASALLDVWPTQEDFDCYSTVEGFMWPRPSTRRHPIRWWAWIEGDGRLSIGLYRRHAAWIEPAGRRSKRERADTYASTEAQRQLAVRDGMSAPVIRLADDGRWRVEGRRAFANDADIRTARLHCGKGEASKIGIGIDPLPTANPDAHWYLRSLRYPVCVTSENIRSGMDKLRVAVKLYVKTFGVS